MFGPPRLLEYFSINPSFVNLQEDRLGGGGVGKLLEEGAKRLEGTANSSRGPELIKKKQSETESNRRISNRISWTKVVSRPEDLRLAHNERREEEGHEVKVGETTSLWSSFLSKPVEQSPSKYTEGPSMPNRSAKSVLFKDFPANRSSAAERSLRDLTPFVATLSRDFASLRSIVLSAGNSNIRLIRRVLNFETRLSAAVNHFVLAAFEMLLNIIASLNLNRFSRSLRSIVVKLVN